MILDLTTNEELTVEQVLARWGKSSTPVRTTRVAEPAELEQADALVASLLAERDELADEVVHLRTWIQAHSRCSHPVL